MAKQAHYVKTVNGYKIYGMHCQLDGLCDYVVSKDGIVHASFDSLVEAEDWANAH